MYRETFADTYTRQRFLQQIDELREHAVELTCQIVFDPSGISALQREAGMPLLGDGARFIYDLGVRATEMLGYTLTEFGSDVLPIPSLTLEHEGQISYPERHIYIRRESGNAMARTILHELAHALSEPLIRALETTERSHYRVYRYAECVAEGAAALVMDLYGFDISGRSIPYLISYQISSIEPEPLISDTVHIAEQLNELLSKAETMRAAAAA